MSDVDVGLIVYDFDGVLTDNRVWVNQGGEESVVCNRSDGWWIAEIRKLGIEQVILSTEKNPVVAARGRKLGIEVFQGLVDKRLTLIDVAGKKDIPLGRVCYVGNEMNDFACMEIVGYSLAPQDSHPEILRIAKRTLPVNGGQGVVRHIYHWLKTDLVSKAPSHLGSSQDGISTTWLREIKAGIQDSIDIKRKLLEDVEALQLLQEVSAEIVRSIKAGKKIIFGGNGGSFSDSIHLAAEFVSRLRFDRAPLASIALGASNSNLTAIGNDYGYEFTFAREIEALANTGDVFIAISTSGNSPNVLLAMKKALERGVIVFGLSNQTGGELGKEVPTIRVPSAETARVQECHILIGHIICELVETALFR